MVTPKNMGRREEPRRVVTAPEKRPVTTRMDLDNFRRLSVRQLNPRTDWPTLIISHRESQQLDPLLMLTLAPTPHRLVRTAINDSLPRTWQLKLRDQFYNKSFPPRMGATS